MHHILHRKFQKFSQTSGANDAGTIFYTPTFTLLTARLIKFYGGLRRRLGALSVMVMVKLIR